MPSSSYSRNNLIPSLSCVIFGMVAFPTIASAQISADNTLGKERSIVSPSISINGNNIDGGAKRGSNLFHSFSEFNVSERQGVYFNNPEGITNIFSRVTGRNPSSILGKLSVLGGNANLFLMNPNGIIFGPHASLDLKGSFVATTANAIQFNEQGVFSASSPETPPLLTVNPSAFIFNRMRPSSISLNSSKEVTGERLFFDYDSGMIDVTDTFGLQVPDGHSLILLGGDVTLTDSHLNALEGRVELGSIAGIGTVGLTIDNNTWSLNFPSNLALGNVSLAQDSRIYTSGDRGGSIKITGNNIQLTGGSSLTAETFGSRKGGNIALTARDTIEIVELVTDPNISTITFGQGDAGDVVLNTEKLLLKDGAQIATFGYGRGDGGKLIVNASETVELIGENINGASSGFSSVGVGDGKGGNIIITTKDLIIQGGAISAAVIESIDGQTVVGRESGGDIIINASNLVFIDSFYGGIFASTNSVGNAGNIAINAGTLTIHNGRISVATYGTGSAGDLAINTSQAVNLRGKDSVLEATGTLLGKAGNLTIKTGQMNVISGAQVKVNNPEGQAGNLTIEAESLLVTGKTTNIIASTESGTAGNLSIHALNLVNLSNLSEISVQADGTGKAGNLTIETGEMSISDQAKVTVSSREGQAGNLNIYTNNIFLDRGFLTAETAESASNGANINLQLSNLLKMQNESLISTKAIGEANGGNITINSPLLAVFKPIGKNGSDIIAKAEQGNGGNILINSQGIFGIAEGKAIVGNKRNDIDASSDFGAPGRVLLNNMIDPSQGTVKLPENVVDPSALIAQNACKKGTASQLTRTGRGGLPPTLFEDFTSKAIQVGLIAPAVGAVIEQQTEISDSDNSSQISPSVPAQGWIFNQKGEVMLVAYDPTVTSSQRVNLNQSGCVVP